MVTIINFEKRQSKSGKEFHALIIQGGIEMVRSAETGQFYATVKRYVLHKAIKLIPDVTENTPMHTN